MKGNNLLLLTGAGFTKNFGGYLGEEMWAKVFNDWLFADTAYKEYRLL